MKELLKEKLIEFTTENVQGIYVHLPIEQKFTINEEGDIFELDPVGVVRDWLEMMQYQLDPAWYSWGTMEPRKVGISIHKSPYHQFLGTDFIFINKRLLFDLRKAFSVESAKELNDILYTDKGKKHPGELYKLLDYGFYETPLPRSVVARIKYFLKYYSQVPGSVLTPYSARRQAYNNFIFYEEQFIDSQDRVNIKELEFLNTLREIFSLQASDLRSGNLEYLSERDFAQAIGLALDEYHNIIRTKRCLNLYDLNRIQNRINNYLNKLNPLTNEALLIEAKQAYDKYCDDYEYRTGKYPREYRKNRLNDLLELYILQNGLDGRTGEPMPLTNNLEIHHLDGNPYNDEFDNKILITRTNHRKINDMRGRQKAIAYQELIENREAIGQGEPGIHWDSEQNKLIFEQREGDKQVLGESYIFLLGLNFRNQRVQSEYKFTANQFHLTRSNILRWLASGYLSFDDSIQI